MKKTVRRHKDRFFNPNDGSRKRSRTVEHKSIKYDKKPKYGVKGFLKED